MRRANMALKKGKQVATATPPVRKGPSHPQVWSLAKKANRTKLEKAPRAKRGHSNPEVLGLKLEQSHQLYQL